MDPDTCDKTSLPPAWIAEVDRAERDRINSALSRGVDLAAITSGAVDCLLVSPERIAYLRAKYPDLDAACTAAEQHAAASPEDRAVAVVAARRRAEPPPMPRLRSRARARRFISQPLSRVIGGK